MRTQRFGLAEAGPALQSLGSVIGGFRDLEVINSLDISFWKLLYKASHLSNKSKMLFSVLASVLRRG